MIRLSHLSKAYGARLLFRDVSARFAEGAVHLITGRNGSGKSTLLRLVGGLSRPTSGEVLFARDDLSTGYLGHATFLYPGLTAVENLAFWQKAYGRPADRREIAAMLERVGLTAFAHTRCAVFSRGMAQRLSLARVLLLAPDICLLDEPETGLDAASRKILEDEILAARDRGACVLWVSHATPARVRPDAVFHLAHKSLHLTRGTPQDQGDAPC